MTFKYWKARDYIEIELNGWVHRIDKLNNRLQNKLPPAEYQSDSPIISNYSKWYEMSFIIEDYFDLQHPSPDEQNEARLWAASTFKRYETCVKETEKIEKLLGGGLAPLLQKDIEYELERWNELMDYCIAQGGFSEENDPTDEDSMILYRDDLYYICGGLTSARNRSPERFNDLDINSIRDRSKQRDLEFAKFLKGKRDDLYESQMNMWWHNPGEGPT